ncbi:FeS assembly ATPase SufC [Candidatus Hodgkinia cicadicola]|nr:FeS assembly ATPase SufC [Candidatus Hodgkinia cicadicola]
MIMIKIKHININFKTKRILSNVSLLLFTGELCIMIGENGIGKTSFINTLSNMDNYICQDWIDDKQHRRGMWWKKDRSTTFVGFQHPIEIPGIIYIHFLRLISKRNNIDKTFVNKIQKLNKFMDVNNNMFYRPMNVDFSGGEKQMFGLIQMIITEPSLCFLDEPDSGLDSKKTTSISKILLGFNISNRTFLVETHNPKLLNYLSSDSIYNLIHNEVICFRKKCYA